MVKGLKLYSYEYRKGLRIPEYLYSCPICQRAYRWGELCEHFLFELRNVPYFTDDVREKEECEKMYEEYWKAIAELDKEIEEGKIDALEYWERLSNLNRKLEKAKEEFVRRFLRD